MIHIEYSAAFVINNHTVIPLCECILSVSASNEPGSK